MNIERWLRVIAGVFIILSLVLAKFLSPYWLLFTAFIGLNLLQSGFTGWCPMVTILKSIGVQPCNEAKQS
ncbi:DUF2892 domain-containing protein [bacterium]|nr:DUF2892 domain-containing protein [candidate division CSSED10-310 bacterium]